MIFCIENNQATTDLNLDFFNVRDLNFNNRGRGKR